MKKILFFFSQNPYPPQNGAHKRCLQLLEGLKLVGGKIMFASSTYRTQSWTDISFTGLTNITGCDDIRIFRPTLTQKTISVCIDYIKKYAYPNTDFPQFLMSHFARRWFTQILLDFEPDVLFINYAYHDAIVPWVNKIWDTSIIEMHDLVTLNRNMQEYLISTVGANSIITGDNIDKILDLEFFEKNTSKTHKSEYEIYDKYQYTSCISLDEKEIVDVNTQKTRAIYLPMTYEVCAHFNSYDSDALFCVGPNPFNSQGYYLFIYKVLPLIAKQVPEFSMKVTGNFFAFRTPTLVGGIKFEGFIEDLTNVYASSRFFVCPVFGGTGQQVKIVEAMAHGLPVIAFRSAASRSPIRHGENGLIANSIEEFAEHVVRLWGSRELCKKLGEAARETISNEYNMSRLVTELEPLLS
jgi:glycosyltransferase involved in cell wall biosynthesis